MTNAHKDNVKRPGDDTETARDFAEGLEPDDLNRDPVADELSADETLPDPEDDHLEREDTHYTEVEDE